MIVVRVEDRGPGIPKSERGRVFEPFARGTAVGHAILLVDRASGEVVGYDMPRRDGSLVSLFEDQYWPDPEMVETLKPYITEVEGQLREVVGRSESQARSELFNKGFEVATEKFLVIARFFTTKVVRAGIVLVAFVIGLVLIFKVLPGGFVPELARAEHPYRVTQ